MAGIWKRPKSFFHRLLIGCLLFSVSFMSMPCWGQSYENGRDFLGEKSDQVVIEEDNPGLAMIILAIVGIVTQIATTAWAVSREREKPKPDPEKISEFTNELDQLKSDLKTKLNEFGSKLEGKIDDAKAELDDKIDLRQEVDVKQSKDIARLQSKVEQVIPKVQEILPKLEEALEKAEKLLPEMEDRIQYFRVVENELRNEIESLKEADSRQLETIESLQESVRDLRIIIRQEVEKAKEAMREGLRKEAASLKAVDAEQTKRIRHLEKLREVITDQAKRIENLERRRIRFGLAAGAWSSESIKNSIIVYEGQLLIDSDITLFGGGGSDSSRISYYGVKYTFRNILNLGIGGLDSSVLEGTELMFLGGISLGTDKVRLNADYFYVPEEEKASGTRACVAVRF